MKLAAKLTILFLLLTISSTAVVGYLGYENGRRTIIQETVDHLVSINIFKSQELQRWVEDSKNDMEALAQRPLLRQYAGVLAKHDLPDLAYHQAQDSIIEDHLQPRLKYGGFLELFVMCPRHGHISASTDERQEGKYRDTDPYYLEGKSNTYVQGVYYSTALEQTAMTISTPVTDKQGSLVGVLAGRLDLGELSRIIALQTGESPTEDTYLVNTFNFFVTEPRFGKGYALKKAVRTEGVDAGLAGKDGVGFYRDYRGVPVIGAYKWLPQFNMCIITEIDQAEAFAPAVRLAWMSALIAGVIAIGAGLLGLIFARTITRPVRQLVAGVEEIGAGNLECRVGTASEDEIGELSRAFDRMAENLKATMVSRDELAKSEERFRLMFARHQAIMLLIEPETGQIIDANRSAENFYGYTMDDLRTMAIQDINVLTPEEVAAERNRALEEERNYFIFPHLLASGEIRTIEAHSSPIMVNDKNVLFSIIHDITERKRAEEMLRHNQAQLQAILDHSPTLISIKDLNGNIILANRNLAVLDAPPLHELIGRNVFDLFPRDVAEKLWHNDLAALQSGGPLTFEEVVRHKDGAWHTYLTVKFPLYVEHNQPSGICAISTDITERKRGEDELRRLNEDLIRSNRELEQFAYVASHDLQEPLRMVSSFTQLLASRYQGRLDQDADDFIHYAVDGANRMQQLIQDLLTYSRITTRGSLFLPLDLQETLGEAVANLHTAIIESAAVVTNGELPMVNADRTQLVQVFQNLVGNAIKFRKQDEPPRVHVSAERAGHEWIISVKDNGIGIEPQYFQRLFVIFQRLHGKQDYPGTGIGLALCQRIMARHGGRIWVESTPGEGATFRFAMKDDV
jgi:PAS domain S-box-containing protein